MSEKDASVSAETTVDKPADADEKAVDADTAAVADAADADDADDDAVEGAAEADDAVEDVEGDDAVEDAVADAPKRSIQWSKVVAFGVLPALALILALGAGYLKWLDDSYSAGVIEANPTGRLSPAEESVRAAKDTTIALLSYRPETVEQQLGAARDLLTGDFRESYTALTNDVVIPGAKEKQIAAVASVPAAASVSVTSTEAVVLVFVNQTVSVGQDPPTDTASSVRVTLEKVGDRWLISQFDPV
ncbi:hypothetical protein [Mycolicibacterium sp.]|uniref:hypothetical protein n=1 Tax=Mycolicibacterium sp. TaxID=2320850 RepID=UPI003D0E0E62